MRLINITLLLAISAEVFAANIYIKGFVQDSNGTGLPNATITVKRASDSTISFVTYSDKDGLFSVELQDSTEYIIDISHIGYETYTSTYLPGDLGIITLKPDILSIKEATVIASRTSHHADGYTVSLRSSDIVRDKSTSEALVFLPGVSRQASVYRINGMDVSEIYVDGMKLTNFSELDNIPAERIDKIKVNYLAGVGQNASVSGGTIEITLKKVPEGGYSGSISAMGGYANYGGLGNTGMLFQARYGKTSIYNSLTINGGAMKEQGWQSTRTSGGELFSEKDEQTSSPFWGIQDRLSLNREINKRNNIGISYYVGWSQSAPETKTREDNLSTSMLNRSGRLTQEATVRYSSVFNDRGTSMDVTADWLNRILSTEYIYTYDDGQTRQQVRSAQENRSNMLKLAVDFSDPLSEKLELEYGASAQYITSSYSPESVGQDGSGIGLSSSLPTRTRAFTPISYASVTGKLWKIQYSAGLNLQMNWIEYTPLDGSNSPSRNIQWGVNPSVQLRMPLDSRGRFSLRLNYRHQLDNIPYDAISSTVRWIDPWHYSVGNPGLVAPTRDRVMLGLSLFGDILTLQGSYTHSSNSIYWDNLADPDRPGVFYETPVNIPRRNSYGLNAELNISPLKPWRIKLSAEYTFNVENSTISGVTYRGTNVHQFYMLLNQLSFKGWGAAINAVYDPEFRSFGYIYHSVYTVNLQLYKTFLDGRLRVALAGIVAGKRRRIDRRVGNQVITHAYTTPAQTATLSVFWSFAGGRKVNVRRVGGGQSYEDIVNDI